MKKYDKYSENVKELDNNAVFMHPKPESFFILAL